MKSKSTRQLSSRRKKISGRLVMGFKTFVTKAVILNSESDFSHYDYKNLLMQYTEIFFQKQKVKILLEKFRFFLTFSLKTYIVGTRLNRLAEAVLTSTHNVSFGAKIRKSRYTPAYPSFAI